MRSWKLLSSDSDRKKRHQRKVKRMGRGDFSKMRVEQTQNTHANAHEGVPPETGLMKN